MKNYCKISLLTLSFILAGNVSTNAQNYKLGGGVFIDFGNGATAVGPHLKYFFNENISVQPAVLFVTGTTVAGADIQYNGNIPGTNGLSWNVGAGPQIWFGDGYSEVVLRPSIGLEYTIPQVPLNFGFDWRPVLSFDQGTYFTAARFGVGFKYIFRK